jgi:hypothetical protein
MAEVKSMSDRVGVAVLEALMGRRGFEQVFDGIDDDIVPEIREAVGRAAIESLRVPTEAMKLAGQMRILAQTGRRWFGKT